VIAEWWRDHQWDAARWLDGVEVEPVDESLARITGEVLGELRLGREHTIDDDMTRLAMKFPSVRVLSV
jgi:hypothetical protein